MKTYANTPQVLPIQPGVVRLRTSVRTAHRYGAMLALPIALAACGGDNYSGSDGPNSSVQAVVHQTGNATAGRDVFRFELFGNERFWTDAIRLQQGFVAAGVTPVQALQMGLSVDSEALDAATLAIVTAEAKTDLSLAMRRP